MVGCWVEKIVYCSGLSLLSCHCFDSYLQHQFCLHFLPFSVNCLALLGLDTPMPTWLLPAASLSSALIWNSIGFIPSASLSPWCSHATAPVYSWTLVWLYKSWTDILLIKSTNCSSFILLWSVAARLDKQNFTNWNVLLNNNKSL